MNNTERLAELEKAKRHLEDVYKNLDRIYEDSSLEIQQKNNLFKNKLFSGENLEFPHAATTCRNACLKLIQQHRGFLAALNQEIANLHNSMRTEEVNQRRLENGETNWINK